MRHHFFEQEFGRHEPVLLALLQQLHYLVEHAGNLPKTSKVIFVVLRAVERHQRDQLWNRDLDAVQLIDRHLVVLELQSFERFLVTANHQLLVELVLLRHAGGIDGLEARQKSFRILALLLNMRQREIAELIVVAIVAIHCGGFR